MLRLLGEGSRRKMGLQQLSTLRSRPNSLPRSTRRRSDYSVKGPPEDEISPLPSLLGDSEKEEVEGASVVVEF